MHPTVRYSWVRRNIQFLVQTCPMNAIICFRVHIRLSQIRLKERSIRIEIMILKLAKIAIIPLFHNESKFHVVIDPRAISNLRFLFSPMCKREIRWLTKDVRNWNCELKFWNPFTSVRFFLSLSLTREFVNSLIHRNKVRILEKISRYDIYWAKLRSICSSFSRNYNSQLEANTCDVCIWS